MKSRQRKLIKLGETLAKNPKLIAQSQKLIKPKNYLALNPLLQKGGLHDKDNVKLARKKHRRQSRQDLKKTNWLSQDEI